MPALGEGKFVVQINVLDLNQKPVATYNYNWLIDVTPPAANALTANTGSGSTAGDVWKLGLEATGQYDFTSSGVSDANGIDKGLIYIYRQDGSLYSTTQMQYDVSGQKMYHTYSKNSVKGTGIPDSNPMKTSLQKLLSSITQVIAERCQLKNFATTTRWVR